MNVTLRRLSTGESTFSTLSLAAYLEQWITTKRALRPTTRRNYESNIKHYLVPTLGHIRLIDLSADDVDRLIDVVKRGARVDKEGRRVGVGATSVRRVHGVLSSALSDAVKRRLIPYNPALQVDLPSQPHTERRIWTTQQVLAFFRATNDDRFSALYWLVTVAGLRRGEALGLRWRDIDLDAGALSVRRQHVDVGGTIIPGAPKTRRGARTVTLDPGTVAILRQHRVAQLKDKLKWGDDWIETGLVFTRADGSPLRPEFATRHFQLLAREAGLPVIRLHDLRHVNASLLLAAGVPTKVVSDRLGHSSVQITQDLYTHVMPATDRQAAAALAALLGDGAGPRATTDAPRKTRGGQEVVGSTTKRSRKG